MGLLQNLKETGGNYVKKAVKKSGEYKAGLKEKIYQKVANASDSAYAIGGGSLAALAEIVHTPQIIAPLLNPSGAYVLPHLIPNIGLVLMAAAGAPLVVKGAKKISKEDLKRAKESGIYAGKRIVGGAKGAYESGIQTGKKVAGGVKNKGIDVYESGINKGKNVAHDLKGAYKSRKERIVKAYEGRVEKNMREKVLKESEAYENILSAQKDLEKKSKNLEDILEKNKNNDDKYENKLLIELTNEKNAAESERLKMSQSLDAFRRGKSNKVYVPKLDKNGKLTGDFTESYAIEAKRDELKQRLSELRGYVGNMEELQNKKQYDKRELSKVEKTLKDLASKQKGICIVVDQLEKSEVDKEYINKVSNKHFGKVSYNAELAGTYEQFIKNAEKEIAELGPKTKGAQGKIKSIEKDLKTLEKMLN